MDTSFADLNVVYTDRQELINILRRCVQISLNKIAVSLAVTLTDNEKANVDQFKEPHESFLAEINQLRKQAGSRVKIFTRLTIRVANKAKLSKFVQGYLSKLPQKFDLLAVIPKSQDCFMHICNDFKNYDILSFDVDDFEAKIFHLAHHLKTLSNEKIMIELCYSDFFFPDEKTVESMRKLALAKDLYRRSKVKNYILSSGAAAAANLRRAVDIVNMSYLLDWKPAQIRHFLNHNSRVCLNRAITREKTAGGYFSVVDVFHESDLSERAKGILRFHLNNITTTATEERKRKR